MRFKTSFFLILTAGALTALFFAMRPSDHAVVAVLEPTTARSTINDAPIPLEPQKARTFKITLADGKRVAGPELISVKRGERVDIEFTSDRSAELHLHGYDIALQLKPEHTANLHFTAEHAGRFEYELHGHTSGHHALGAIEVLP